MEQKDGVKFFKGNGEDNERSHVLQQDIKSIHPLFKREGWSVTFGEWPQNLKSDNVSITEITDQRG